MLAAAQAVDMMAAQDFPAQVAAANAIIRAAMAQ
jgi:hypothetical protein